jgi:glycosyltransferase involved in cell wall biosynthesis
MRLHSLYLCYFGLREPLVQTQVLPYLRQLAAGEAQISLLTFEPSRENWSAEELADARARLAEQGIKWHWLAYHKRPSMMATLYDVLAGARLARRLIRGENVNVLHARAHIPMAMAMLAAKASVRLIFDLRGLMAEEYRDAGVWTEGSLPFRVVKRIESAGLRRADQVVVLTRSLCDWLINKGLATAERIEVIPCCVDWERFDAVEFEPEASTEPARFEVIYAGSLGGLYLVEEMGRFFKAIKERRPNAFLRLLSISPPEQGADQLRQAGLNADDFWIGAVPAAEVPSYLRRASLGISFRKPTFAQIAASPTKIPEYLAAGLPVVSNAGIGDVDSLLESERVGVIVRDFTAVEFTRAAEVAQLLAEDPTVRAHCAAVARLHFDLQSIGGKGYANVYRRIANLNPQGATQEAYNQS